MKFCCRSPREVVSWKIILLYKRALRPVDLHERSWVEKLLIKAWLKRAMSISTRGRELKNYKFLKLFFCCIVDLHERSWVENFRSAFYATLKGVDLHERSWVEKLLLQVFPQGHPVDLHERSWVEKSPLIKWYWLIRVDLHERSWVEKSYSQKIEQRF